MTLVKFDKNQWLERGEAHPCSPALWPKGCVTGWQLLALFRCHQSIHCGAITLSPVQQAATGHLRGAKRDEGFAGGLRPQGTQGAKCMGVGRLMGIKADAATLGMKPLQTITKSFGGFGVSVLRVNLLQ